MKRLAGVFLVVSIIAALAVGALSAADPSAADQDDAASCQLLQSDPLSDLLELLSAALTPQTAVAEDAGPQADPDVDPVATLADPQQGLGPNSAFLPADRQFFDDFENAINAGGRHGWSRVWARDCEWNPRDYEREITQSSRFHFSPRYARTGSYSFRVECRQHDRVTDSDKFGGNERAEISRRYHENDDGEGRHGDERWYGVSLLLPADMPAIPADGAAIVTQFLKENNSSAPYPNPTLDVRVKQRPGGAHFLEVYNRRKTGSGSAGWTVVLTDLGDLDRERWVDLAFHIRWATDHTGFWEVWKNGALAASADQTPTLPGERHTTFHKIGVYSWNIAATRSIHYDAYWMGKTPPPYAEPLRLNRLFLDALEGAMATPVDAVREGLF